MPFMFVSVVELADLDSIAEAPRLMGSGAASAAGGTSRWASRAHAGVSKTWGSNVGGLTGGRGSF